MMVYHLIHLLVSNPVESRLLVLKSNILQHAVAACYTVGSTFRYFLFDFAIFLSFQVQLLSACPI